MFFISDRIRCSTDVFRRKEHAGKTNALEAHRKLCYGVADDGQKQQRLTRTVSVMDKSDRKRLLLCFFAENALPISVMQDRLFKRIVAPEFRGLLKSRQTMMNRVRAMHLEGKKTIRMTIEVGVYRRN